MSNEQPPEQPRKVTPYRPGKRVSTFRRIDVEFAGTALEQALAEREKMEQEGSNRSEPSQLESSADRFSPSSISIEQAQTGQKTDAGGYTDLQSGGYTPSLVATNVATVLPMVATNVATTSSSGYTDLQSGGYTKNRTSDRHDYSQKEQFNIRLSKDKVKKIEELRVKLRLSKQAFWDLVATRIIELSSKDVATFGLVFEGLVATNVAHDDMMIFKTHDDIIMRFETYTNQKWTRRDDRDGRRYNEVDIRLIDIAFISTIEKKLRGATAKQPIKSFNYFTEEIDLLVEQHLNRELPNNLDEYHKYVLTTWEKRIKSLRDTKWPKVTR